MRCTHVRARHDMQCVRLCVYVCARVCVMCACSHVPHPEAAQYHVFPLFLESELFTSSLMVFPLLPNTVARYSSPPIAFQRAVLFAGEAPMYHCEDGSPDGSAGNMSLPCRCVQWEISWL